MCDVQQTYRGWWPSVSKLQICEGALERDVIGGSEVFIGCASYCSRHDSTDTPNGGGITIENSVAAVAMVELKECS
jgi:hypothetical protein